MKTEIEMDFEDLWNRCMNDDEIIFHHEDSSTIQKTMPVCIIRVFEEGLGFPDCDREFTIVDFNEAKKHFMENFPFVRVMGVSGSIFFSYY